MKNSDKILKKYKLIFINKRKLNFIPITFLTHLWAMFPFYTPWKQQKTFGFLVFSGGME